MPLPRDGPSPHLFLPEAPRTSRMPSAKSRTTRTTRASSGRFRTRPTASGRRGSKGTRTRTRRPRRAAATMPRTRTTSRTGARRAARLRKTLDGRPKSMSVEFEDLGPEDDNSKEARDRRADDRRLRQDHPDLYVPRTDE